MAFTPLSDLRTSYQHALVALDKATCVRLIQDALSSASIDVIELYQDVLSPALNESVETEMGKDNSIWKEHVRSEITRTVIESCYPFVLKAAAKTLAARRNKSAGKVMIVLPAEEFHELGARMGADFFQILGFEALFVGSNTPCEAIMNGISYFQPDYIDIHVVNYYNLFKAKELIAAIKQINPAIKILASGYAFTQDPDQSVKLGPICLINSYADIASLVGEQLGDLP
ncbi:MAG: cobalamin-dependent protein [Eubacteriales bacterium]|nr:cobalamin-dependent protein [Eubacteriales bacterium]